MANGDRKRQDGRTAFRRALTAFLATVLAAAGVLVLGVSPAAAVGTPSIDSSPTTPTLADPLVWTFSNANPAVCVLVDPNGTTVDSVDGCTSPTSFDVSSGPAGSYTLTVYATDTAANIDGSTPSANDSVNVAPLAPTFTNEPTTPFNDPTPTWDFTLDSGAVATCELDHPNGTAIQTVPNCTSPFTADDLTASSTNGDPGNYRLSVVQTVAGLDSAPAHSTYDFETAKPSTPHVSADSSIGFDQHPTFTVTNLDGSATPTCWVTPSANASVQNCGNSPSLDLSGASDGTYTLHVTQTFAGNVSDEGSDTYQLDTHTPNRPSVSADSAYGSSAAPSFTVSGIDGDAQPECSVSGPTNVSVSQCDTSTVLDLTGADAGTYTLSVDAKDTAGKSGPADTATYEYLPSAPPAPHVQAPSAAGNDPTPSFTVSDSEDATLTYNCTVTAANSDASLTVPAPACNPTTHLDLSNAPDDTYTLTVTATDQLGQTSPAGSDTYTLDTGTPAPNVSLATPGSSPSTVTTPTFTITDGETANGPDTFTCEWDAPDGSLISTGSCASGDGFGTAGNGNGRYTLTVTAHDAVGNSHAAAPVTYALEASAPPAPTVTAVGSNPSSSPTAVFNVTDSENVNLTYTCNVVGWPASVVTACGPTTTIDLGSAGDGTYTLRVRVTDELSQISPAGHVDYVLDTIAQAPTVSLASPASSPSTDTSPRFTITDNELVGGPDDFTCTWDGPAGTTVASCTSGDTFPTGVDGDYTLTVTATDVTGNTSAPSSPAAYSLDTAAPNPPTVALATPSSSPGKATAPTFTVTDPGDTSPGGLTYHCTVTETSVTPNVVLPGSAVNCGPTTSVDLSGTGDGDYSVSVTASDAAGNTSGGAGVAFYTLDSAVPGTPTVALATPASSPGRATHPTFSVSDPGDTSPGGLTYHCTVTETSVTPNVTLPGSAVTCGTTTSVDLSGTGDGDYSVSVTATDAAGNTSASGSATYTLDATAPAVPTVTLATPASSPGNATVPTFTVTNPGDTSPGGLTYACTVTETSVTPNVTVAASDVTCGPTTTVHLGPTGDGDYSVSVTATDASGNTGPAGAATYTLDGTAPAAPTVTLATPSSSPGNATVPTFTVTSPGDTSPGGLTYHCTVTETSVTPNITVGASDVTCGPVTSVNLGPSGNGDYSVSVTATDASGNTGSAGTASYTLDGNAPAAPTVVLATPASSPGQAQMPTFTVTNPGDTSPGGLTYHCTVTETSVTPNVTVAASDVACGPTTIVDLSATGDGDYSVSVTATDAAGNASTGAGTATYSLDTTDPAAPTVTLATPASSPGKAKTPTFTVTNPGDVSPGGLTYACTVTETSVTPNVVLPGSAVNCGPTTSVNLTATGDGDYSVSVTATDAAGNTSATAGTATYTLDATRPARPVVTLLTPAGSPAQSSNPTFGVSVAGDSSPGGLTYSCTVTETSVTPNVTLPGSAVSCGTTTSVDLSGTGDGDYTLAVTATDAAGNNSLAGSASYSMDTSAPAAPTVVLTTPSSSPGNATAPTFTVTDPGDVSPGGLTYDCTVTETSVTPNVTVAASDVSCGPTTTVDLSATGDGDYSISVTATDAAGNTSATAGTATYTLDTAAPAAPVVTLATPASSPSQTTVPTFTVTNPGDTSPGGLTYHCTVTKTSATPNITVPASDVTCGPVTSVNLGPSGDGDYTLSVTATDASGNTGSAGTASYSLDTTKPATPTVVLATPSSSPGQALMPTFTVTNPGDTSPGGLTYHCTVTETSVTPNVTVAASDVACGPTTIVDLSATGDGDYSVSVTATDAAGNASTGAGTATYSLDTTAPGAPVVTLATPASSPGKAKTPTFTVTNPGDTSPGGVTYDCTVTETSVTPNVVLPGSAVTCGPTTSVNLTSTGDGDYSVSVTATDAAGNTSASAGTATYTLDGTAPATPVVTLATPASSPGNSNSPTFSVTNPGDTSPGGLTYHCTVTETSVTPNVTLPGSAVTCGTTTSVDLSGTGDGDYTVSVTVTDAAGNNSAAAGTASYTFDATAPAVPTVTLATPASSPGNATVPTFTVTNPGDTSPGGLTYACTVTETSVTPNVTVAASDVSCGPTTTVDLSATGDGDYSISVTATDAAGNTSASAGTATYTLDTAAPAAPVVALATPASSPGNATVPTFTVTSPGDTSPGGVTYHCTVTKTSVTPNVTVPASDVICGPVTSVNLGPSGDGDYTLSVTATDASGNTGSAGTASYSLDTTKPASPTVVRATPASSPGQAQMPTFTVTNPGDTSPGGLTYHCTVTETSVTPNVTVAASDVACGPTTIVDLSATGDGDYSVSVTATDAAGNTSAGAGTATYSLDTTAPGAPVVTLATPASSPGKAKTPTFTVTNPGDTSPGGLTYACTVTETSVTPNVVLPGSAVNCGPTTSVNLTATGDGDYSVSVTATDAAGNTSASAGTATYTLDATRPARPNVSLATPASSPGNSNSPTFTVTNPGDVSPGGLTYHCTVTETSVIPNVVLPGSAVTCGPTTSVDLSATGDGDYTLSVTVTDAAGNNSLAAGTASYTLDATAPAGPTVTLATPASSPGNATVPTFTVTNPGDVSPGGLTYACTVTETSVTPNVTVAASDVSCGPTTTVDLSATGDGDYSISVTATDAAGNTSATAGTATYTLDTATPAAPIVTLATPASSPSQTTVPTFTVTNPGDTSPGGLTYHCTVTKTSATPNITVPASDVTCGPVTSVNLGPSGDGDYTVSVTATDASGNTGSAGTASYSLDTTKPATPTVVLATPSSSPGQALMPTFTVTNPGDVSPGGLTYHCTVTETSVTPNVTVAASDVACGPTTIVDLSATGDGDYSVSVTATDAAGNTSTSAGTATYSLDTTDPATPTVVLTTPASSPGASTNPTFTVTNPGDTSPGGLTYDCTVTETSVTPNVVLPGSAVTCGPTTTLHLGPTGDGDYSVSVTATDAAGNTSASAGTATYTLDGTAPATPVVTLATPASSPGNSNSPTFSVTNPGDTSPGGLTYHCTVTETSVTPNVTLPGSAVTCGTTTSVDLSGTGDGDYTVSVTVTDAAGNNSAAAGTASYTFDATAPAVPTVTLATPASSPGNATVPTFTVTNPGDTSPGGLTYACTVTETSVTPNVTVAASDVTCGPTTTVHLGPTGDGDYSVSVTATDAAGNTSASAGTATYTLDTTLPPAPTVTLSSPASSPSNARTAQFTVTDPDTSPGGVTFSCVVTETSATPQVTLPPSRVTCGSTTTVDLSAAPDGDYSLAVIATDAAGNASPAGTATYTLDATTPAAPTVVLTFPAASPGHSSSPQFSVSNPGDVSPGGITYNCTATFKTSPVGPVNPVPAADISCGPTTSLDLSSLSDARYTLSVTATDASGNTGPAATASYTYDATPPATPVVALTSPAGSPGNATTATFSVANPGDTSPGGLTYSCTVTETSASPVVTVPASDVTCGPITTVDLSSTGDGDYQLSVTATDKAGNTSATPGTARYTLDTNRPGVPTVTLATPASSPGNVTSPQFTVTDPDTSPGGLTYTCSVVGRTIVPQSAITCGPTTTVDLSGAGRDGMYTLSVTATDAAGNSSTGAGTASYTLDTTLPGTPVVTLTAPARSPGNSTSPQFSVSNPGDNSPGGLTYACTVTDTSTATPLPGSDITCGPTTTVDLSTSPDGSYTLAVIATDKAGNTSVSAGTAIYDMDTTDPPAPAVTVPPASTKMPVFGISDGDPTAVLSCLFVAPGARTVFPNGGSSVCPANGTFDTTAFPDGDYTLTVTATDPAGNVTSTTVTWTRDTTPPPTPTVNAPASPSNDRNPTFTVRDAEAGATLTCLFTGPDSSGRTEFSGNCPGDGTIPITGGDGVYTLTVTASDAAGNVTPVTASDTYTLDTARPNQPVVVRTSPAASPDNVAQVRFAVSDPDASPGGITFNCTVNGPTPVPASQISCGSTTVVDLSGSGRDGTYTLSVTATDAAGNTSSAAGTAAYRLDTTPPPAPTVDYGSPASSPGHDPMPTFLVTDADTSPGMTFTCSVTGATPVPDADVTCGPTTTVNLNGTDHDRDGDYTLSVTATDASGNTSTSAGSIAYTLDTVPPAAPDVSRAGAVQSNQTNPKWTWEYGLDDVATDVDIATCTINGPPGYTSQPKINCAHVYAPTLGPTNGAYTLTVTLTDPAGNTASGTSPRYILDSHAPPGPTVLLKHPTHFAGLTRHPVWSVSGPGELRCTLLRGGDNGTPIAPEADCPVPTTYSLAGFKDGMFTLRVVAVDSSQNSSYPAYKSYVLAPHAPQVDPPKSDSAHAVWSVTGNPHDGLACTLWHAGTIVAPERGCSSRPTYDMSGRPAGTYTLSVVQIGPKNVRSAPGTASWDWAGARANNHPNGGPPSQNGNPPGPTGPPVPGGFKPRHHPASSLLPPGVNSKIGPFLHQTTKNAGGAASSLIPPFIHSVHPNRLADAVTSAVQGVVQAVGSAGGGTGFPLLLLGFVLAFVIAQNRIDRRDPKLALASVAADDLVEFKLPPSRRDGP